MAERDGATFTEGVVRLCDGRKLAYRELGPRDGYPLLYFHGLPGVRGAIAGRPDDYAAAGVRLLTFDRPGYGLSSPHPSALVADWPDDVEQVMTALGIGDHAVIGESAGAAYALACARRRPRGLSTVIVSSGLAPIDGARSLAGMKRVNQAALVLLRRRWLASGVFGALVAAFLHWPDAVLDAVLCQGSPKGDAQLLRDPRIRAEAMAMLSRTAALGVGGVIDDIGRVSSPWGFDLGDIRMPVHFWHGDADNTAPLRQILGVARRIPGSILVVCPGEGHMVMERHLPEMLALVRSEGRSAPGRSPAGAARG